MSVLYSINEAYHQQTTQISNYANKLTKVIQQNVGDSDPGAPSGLDDKPLVKTVRYFKELLFPKN